MGSNLGHLLKSFLLYLMGNEWKDYSNLSILNAQCNNHKNVCLFYCTQKGERNMPELFGLMLFNCANPVQHSSKVTA